MNDPDSNQPGPGAPRGPGGQPEELTQPAPDGEDPRLPGTTDENTSPSITRPADPIQEVPSAVLKSMEAFAT